MAVVQFAQAGLPEAKLRDKMYGELALRTEKAQEPKVVDYLTLMAFLTVAGELFLKGVEILQKLLEVFL